MKLGCTKGNYRDQGFTLVELLIVIVVIAILAGISVVAYSGVQNRTITSQISTAASHYEKAFLMTLSEKGVFTEQPIDIPPRTCMGEPSDYPATPNFPAGVCGVHSGGSTIGFEPAFLAETSKQLSSIPKVPTKYEYNSSYWRMRGGHITAEHDYAKVVVVLTPEISCPSNMKTYKSESGDNWCEIMLYRD